MLARLKMLSLRSRFSAVSLLTISASLLYATQQNTKYNIQSLSVPEKKAPNPLAEADITQARINHLKAFSENGIVSRETIIKRLNQDWKVHTAPAEIIALAFMQSLESNGAPNAEKGSVTIVDAATYGHHAGAVGFFRRDGQTRLSEIKNACIEVDGKLLLFKSAYDKYAADVIKYDVNAKEAGISCIERAFGRLTAKGEEFITFNKINGGEMIHPATGKKELFIDFTHFAELINNTQVVANKVSFGELPVCKY